MELPKDGNWSVTQWLVPLKNFSAKYYGLMLTLIIEVGTMLVLLVYEPRKISERVDEKSVDIGFCPTKKGVILPSP